MVTTAVTTAVTTVATHPQQQGNILQGAGMTVNRRAYLSNGSLPSGEHPSQSNVDTIYSPQSHVDENRVALHPSPHKCKVEVRIFCPVILFAPHILFPTLHLGGRGFMQSVGGINRVYSWTLFV